MATYRHWRGGWQFGVCCRRKGRPATAVRLVLRYAWVRRYYSVLKPKPRSGLFATQRFYGVSGVRLQRLETDRAEGDQQCQHTGHGKEPPFQTDAVDKT